MTEPVPRRRFLDLLLAGQFLALFSAVLYPLLSYLFPSAAADQDPPEVKVGPAAELAPGGAKLVKMGARPVLVVRTAEGEVRAFNARCTHLNCTVQFRKESSDIWCACHDARYDLAGKVLGGPPPRPLPSMTVEVRDGDLWVKKA